MILRSRLSTHPYEYHVILQKHVLHFTYNTRYVISGLGQVQQQQVIVVFTLYSMRAWETDRAEEATISRADDAGETRTMMMTMRCLCGAGRDVEVCVLYYSSCKVVAVERQILRVCREEMERGGSGCFVI